MVHIVGKTRIYLIYLRIINDIFYVGRTSGFGTEEELLRVRAGDCFRGYRTYSGKTKFWKAIEKYGWWTVKSYPLAVCETLKDAKNLETFFIYKFDSVKNGYNETYGDGDRDAGEILYYNTLTLFDKCDCGDSDSDCDYIKKNRYEYNKKFVKYIVENKIKGRKRILEKANEWGIVKSTLQHYLYQSSDPNNNRYDADFYELWMSEDDIEETTNGALFE